MKVDITSMFFNSTIEGKTATPAWGTSIGQNASKSCRIETEKEGVVDFVIGMTYKSTTELELLDISKGSSNRELLMLSSFDKVYINNIRLEDAKYHIILVKELSDSHYGRLIVCYAPYIKFKGYSNEETIELMKKALGCSTRGCWFVYDISIKNQDELHFAAIVLDPDNPKVYHGTSKDRSLEWNAMIERDVDAYYKVNENQVIYYGCPGSGKSNKVRNIVNDTDSNSTFRTTFHPDTDYASFVGCYKPTTNDGSIEYSYTAQVFTKAYVTAWQNVEKPVYLIIEEINRGNCAQIFGDLFQLLDRDKKNGKSEYPIKADKDLCAYIERELGFGHEGIKNGELCLPPNLIIYATMNTSDQSLFPMDSAFKRRWDWEYVPIDYSKDSDSGKFYINIGDTEYLWVDFLEKVNDKIYDVTNSEDKQMGNFFIKRSVDTKEFINKVMFYLWNEICKEEYGTQRNFFRRGSESKTEFKFIDLFGDDQSTILNEFMTSLGVEPINKKESEKTE